jgi:type I restriction enzyme R subunit
LPPSILTASRRLRRDSLEDLSQPRRSATRRAISFVGFAVNVFTGPLIALIDGIRRDKEQTIDHDTLDAVLRAEWEGDAAENATELAHDFQAYLEENRDEIEALTIFYSQPHRRSELTYGMIKEVLDRLKKDRPKLAPLRVWLAYAHLDQYKGSTPSSELTALVALVRRVCGIDKTVSVYSDTIRRNFQDWIMKRHSGAGEKFTEEQMDWLRMIRDHVINSFHMDRDDLDMAPFDAKGGMGRMYQLFGNRMEDVVNELNEVLAA